MAKRSASADFAHVVAQSRAHPQQNRATRRSAASLRSVSCLQTGENPQSQKVARRSPARKNDLISPSPATPAPRNVSNPCGGRAQKVERGMFQTCVRQVPDEFWCGSSLRHRRFSCFVSFEIFAVAHADIRFTEADFPEPRNEVETSPDGGNLLQIQR